MPDPAFIIEGHMEQKILQNICPGKVIQRIGANGDHVSMKVMATHLAPQIRLFSNRYRPVIVLFDRERRDASCEQLRRELSLELADLGIDQEITIGIADRTIENWILADYEMLMDTYGFRPENGNLEGTFGKSELKSRFAPDTTYRETTTGVKIFKECRPDRMYQQSLSFKYFIDSIDIECWWRDQIIFDDRMEIIHR
jgi:hypothetical protein